MKAALVGIVGLVVVAGCLGGSDPGASPSPPAPSDEVPGPMGDVPEGSVRFVVIGDAGQASDAQFAVANAMADVCRSQGCQFVMVAGDNIYSNGVRHEYDPQFEKKFELPYGVVDLPFYLVLGNHDNGNGAGSNPEVGDYQVAYTKRTDRLSTKWNMPARNYKFQVGDVEFFGIDSGPEEVSQLPVWLPGSRGSIVRDWVAAELPKSTAKWKFAFAHHPYVSNGPHGDAGRFDNVLGRGLSYQRMHEEVLCGKVQVFFAGHDHHLQWLKPVQSCGRTEFVISGAGGASLYAKGAAPHNEAWFEDYTNHGFWWVDVTGNTFTGVAYDETGKELFRRTLQA